MMRTLILAIAKLLLHIIEDNGLKIRVKDVYDVKDAVSIVEGD